MHEKSWKGALCSGKCPKCRKGDIFKTSLFDLSGFWKMNNNCTQCGVSFEPEPGFYFGAMFVSYALSVALFATIGIALYVLGNPADWVYLLSIVGGAILFTPFSFRYSRILFLYFFGGIHYDPAAG
ncbi:MAG TPA: DUF983 domain-containing protein [Cytophagales bacterium]|nr:DUF983 domain-containing protein [Cytophagales bacterium]HCR54632.1 DUF983 domain-containing protein [Cytophagales bacterium]